MLPEIRDAAVNLGLATIIAIVAAAVGIVLIMASSVVLPKLIDRMTPSIDEDKEIARGNTAVAEYFGRIVSASIIGISIIIAAAILGGIWAAH